ncbi:helix-hairpin-helix domain-containing protein [Nitrosomonas sp. Nm166]|uniref:helix-hairpin-helix domain-containing protein n=1 Tax=Nitrosomonas sp. Nm166 TaxID=1881054 RepID=UPI0008E77140|nr:helix-hairpin-helix domain-containing protein [Nitrosomonas sp. Nm166]SFD95768.1 Helix-hairpin-helix domain-containing protein [Nitrosomonas sp. Nm166]
MVKLTDVTGIGPVTARLLSEHNINTVEALASISLAELQKVPGFSDLRARAVKKAALDCLQGKTAKQLATSASHPPAPVKKAASPKATVVNQAANQIEIETDQDKDKKKNKKSGKKKEKIKDKVKKKKEKNKNKKKEGTKKGKDKKKS